MFGNISSKRKKITPLGELDQYFYGYDTMRTVKILFHLKHLNIC